MRLRPALLIAPVLLLAACDGGTDTAGVPPELAAAGAARDAGSPMPVDPAAPPAEAARIVSDRTIAVGGEPACLFTIHYPGVQDQEVTWRSEECQVVNASIITPGLLAAGGQLADLPQEARRDIERMTGGVFVAQSQSTAAAYPLDAAGRIYQVPYAD